MSTMDAKALIDEADGLDVLRLVLRSNGSRCVLPGFDVPTVERVGQPIEAPAADRPRVKRFVSA